MYNPHCKIIKYLENYHIVFSFQLKNDLNDKMIISDRSANKLIGTIKSWNSLQLKVDLYITKFYIYLNYKEEEIKSYNSVFAVGNTII